jgi:hypothetical protein
LESEVYVWEFILNLNDWRKDNNEKENNEFCSVLDGVGISVKCLWKR